jgi:hypothetical protein
MCLELESQTKLKSLGDALDRRAAKCIGALAGIPDPAKWRKDLEAKLAAQEEALEYAREAIASVLVLNHVPNTTTTGRLLHEALAKLDKVLEGKPKYDCLRVDPGAEEPCGECGPCVRSRKKP